MDWTAPPSTTSLCGMDIGGFGDYTVSIKITKQSDGTWLADAAYKFPLGQNPLIAVALMSNFTGGPIFVDCTGSGGSIWTALLNNEGCTAYSVRLTGGTKPKRTATGFTIPSSHLIHTLERALDNGRLKLIPELQPLLLAELQNMVRNSKGHHHAMKGHDDSVFALGLAWLGTTLSHERVIPVPQR